MTLNSCASERFIKVWHHGSWDIPTIIQRVPDLDVSFNIDGPTNVLVVGSADIRHRCLAPASGPYKGRVDYAIGIGMRIEHIGTDGVSRWVQGAKWGPNIASCAHHYIDVPLVAHLCLPDKGTHRLSVWASAHSDANSYDGIASISPASDSDSNPGGTSDPYNQMIVRLTRTNHC
jgi:hypothetical protein